MRTRLTVFLLLATGSALEAAPGSLDQTLAAHNRGVSLMERHDFAAAAAEFEKVVKAAPTWPTAFVNLGIAYLNTAKDYDKAEVAFRAALKLDPRNAHAHFSLGVLLEHLARKEESLQELEAAAAIDGNDPDIQFKLGQAYQGNGDLPKAEVAYRHAWDTAPDFASALYALGLLEARSGKRDEGKTHLDTFEKLRSRKEGKTWGLKYTEMGRYAEVIRLDSPATTPARPAPLPIALADATPAGPLYRAATGSLAAADLDGDGDVDLLDATTGRVLLAEGTGFKEGGKGLPSGSPGWLLDIDNDGDLDLVLLKPARIAKNDGGKWATPTPLDLTGDPGSLTIAETDADGDADVVVAGKPSYLLVNNRDGTFQKAANTPPLAEAATAALAFDADGDVDQDLLLLGDEPALLRNDRLWRFTAVARPPVPAGSAAAAAGDLDGDGDIDVAVASPLGITVLQNRGGLTFEAGGAVLAGSCTTVAVADMDRDGSLDIVAGRAGEKPAAVILRGDGRGAFASVAEAGLPAAPLSLLPVDVDRDGDLDLVASVGGSGIRVLRNAGAEKAHAVAITLRGPSQPGEARANRFGVGARVEVKTGGNVEILERGTGCGASQDLGPLVFGLGAAAKADYVRIVWPDGVIQSETEVPAGALAIDEVQRKAGSCPTLFAWDGARFRFIADFLGGGGVGFFVTPGVYGPPDTSESVSVPGLVARDGRLDLNVVEPLEEVTYLDEAKLLAVEHPRGTAVYPDERFAVAEPMPTGKLLTVARTIRPSRAVDGQGRDVLDRLRAVDRSYVTPPHRDPQYLGLAEATALTLLFDADLDPQMFLFLQGWIEYGYSGTVFAAWQSGRVGHPAALDYRDPASGDWRELGMMGYPAGTPRMMTYPLAGIPRGARELRIRTDMTIFWDEAFVALPTEPARVTTISATSADLSLRGYPREYTPDGQPPTLYDYESSDGTRGFKHPAGAYTSFGDVRPLLLAPDDRYVIMGPGDEVALSFDARAVPAPAPGNEISYVLLSDGFCKDMDLYTAFPDTVGPLPFHAMSAYPYPDTEQFPQDEEHRAYERQWNTRIVP